MKRYCKNTDITDVGFIKRCVLDCLNGGKRRRGKRKWLRGETMELLAYYGGMTKGEVRHLIQRYEFDKLDGAVTALAEDLAERIRKRDLTFRAIERKTIRQKNGKERPIGIESMIQQFCDYIAVYGLSEMFYKKIGYSQFACIPGRGQCSGMRVIKKWLRDSKRTRYCVQCDVEKCYDNIKHDVIMEHLRRDVKNDDLLWLIERLIETHGDGLLIGSYLSPFLCNYLISYAWHYMHEQQGGLFEHMATYIDDIILLGGNKRKLKRAFEALQKYLAERLGLRLKPTWRLYRVAYKDRAGRLRGQPIDFMGYRMTRFNVTVRKRIFLELRRAVRRCEKERGISGKKAKTLMSLYGWAKNTDCWRVLHDHKEAFETARKIISGRKIYV